VKRKSAAVAELRTDVEINSPVSGTTESTAENSTSFGICVLAVASE